MNKKLFRNMLFVSFLFFSFFSLFFFSTYKDLNNSKNEIVQLEKENKLLKKELTFLEDKELKDYEQKSFQFNQSEQENHMKNKINE